MALFPSIHLCIGHCVCIQSPMSNVQCSSSGEIMYDPKEVIKVYVGVNGSPLAETVENPRKKGLYEKSVEKVIIHKNWDGSGMSFPDLALLRLSSKVKFQDSQINRYVRKNDGNVMGFNVLLKSINFFFAKCRIVPVCLTTESILKNVNVNVFVSGWGRLRNEDCFTNDYGPNRHTRCRFPFIYEGTTY